MDHNTIFHYFFNFSGLDFADEVYEISRDIFFSYFFYTVFSKGEKAFLISYLIKNFVRSMGVKIFGYYEYLSIGGFYFFENGEVYVHFVIYHNRREAEGATCAPSCFSGYTGPCR